MANYNLYKNIDPGSIKSATSSLRQKLKTSQTKLNSLSSSLSDGVWKSSAKGNLKEAFGKIDSEVYKDIFASLDKLDEAAGLVEKYNDAKAQAETFKGYLNSATDETPVSDISTWKSNLAVKEGIMEDCESKISGLK